MGHRSAGGLKRRRRGVDPTGVSEVRLAEIVAALSHALDLTDGQPEGHAGRTCLIGMRLAAALGVDEHDQAALYHALLLKDSGCSSSAARLSSLFGADDIALKRTGKLVDWTRPREALAYVYRGLDGGSALDRARRTLEVALDLAKNDGLVDARCERGAQIVHELGFPPAAAEAVRALDEHWDGRGRPRRLKGEEIPLLARIACLGQTADVFLLMRGRDAARDMVRGRRGRWFDPRVADAFLGIGDDDPLWDALDNAADPVVVARHDPHLQADRAPDEERIDAIAEAFAQVVDAKSSHTPNHSLRVSEFAQAIGRQMGYDEDHLRMLRRAGLLHDIGKLGISTAVLDKPGRLTDDEFREIQMHPVYGERILQQVSAFAPIAFLAGAHHERLDGRGYPRGLRAADLTTDARIITVADVYEALTADRPYREGMPTLKALGVMVEQAGTAFDPQVLAALGDALHGIPPDAIPVPVPRVAAA